MKKIIILMLLTSSLFSQDLGSIDVDAKVDSDAKVEQSIANDVFEEPEYLEKASYVPKSAGQKRLTTQEALFIPGTQGDPVKALKFIGGVSSSASGSGMGSELYIYGSKPEESSYSLNHLPLGYIFHMGGLHSVIDPNAIEQIDAYLAGFDTTYGDAMGGVIDITPKYPTNETNGYGHMGVFDASAGINVALGDDTAFYLGVRRSYFDIGYGLVGKTKADENNNTIIQFPSYYDATFIFSQNINEENILSLEAITASDKIEIDKQEDSVKDPKATGNINAKSGFTSVGARWSVESENYSANTLLYYMHYYADIELFTDLYIKNESDNVGLFHESTLEYDKHKFVFGFELANSSIPLNMNITMPDSPENPEYDFTTSDVIYINRTIDVAYGSVFLQDIYSLAQNVSLRYGLRLGYSNYQNYGSYVDPRLSVVYEINHQNTLSLSVGQYTQTPEGYKSTKEMGNANISNEQAYHYLLHYDYSYIDRASFSVEPFYKDYSSLAVDDNVTNYENTGEGYAYGVDTSLRYKDGEWYGFVSYTYLRSKREISTTSQPSDFYAEIPHTLQFIGAKRFKNNWVTSALMKYHTGALYSPIVGSYDYTDKDGTTRKRPVYGDAYSQRLPDYFTLNLKIAHTSHYANAKSLEWSFELMNITNHENVLGYTYSDNYDKTGVVTDLPLLPWFDVTYRF